DPCDLRPLGRRQREDLARMAVGHQRLDATLAGEPTGEARQAGRIDAEVVVERDSDRRDQSLEVNRLRHGDKGSGFTGQVARRCADDPPAARNAMESLAAASQVGPRASATNSSSVWPKAGATALSAATGTPSTSVIGAAITRSPVTVSWSETA